MIASFYYLMFLVSTLGGAWRHQEVIPSVSAPARADYTISGAVVRADGTPLPNVPVVLSGHVSTNQLTDANGQFSFTNLPEGFDYVVTPGQPAVTNPISGVSIYDIILIRRAILSVEFFQNPCQTLAADVNNDASGSPVNGPIDGVSTLDMALINQVLLGVSPGFSPEWEYMPADSNFFGALAQPMSMQFNNLSANEAINILAIKAGDVSGCVAPPTTTSATPAIIADVNAVVNQGAIVSVPVRVEQFQGIMGFQFAIQWDPSILEYQSISGLSLPGFAVGGIGTQNASNGELRISWHDTSLSGLTLPNGSAIFTLNFTAIGPPGSSTPVDISPTNLPFEVVYQDSATLSISGINDVDGLVEIAGVQNAVTLQADIAGVFCTNQAGFASQIAVPIRVENFNDITSLQFTFRWNPQVLSYQGVFNFGLPMLGAANFGASFANTQNGILTMSWTSGSPVGVSLPDGSSIVTVFLNLYGAAGTSSPIYFADAPVQVGATDDTGMALQINTVNGFVQAKGPEAILGPLYCYDGAQFFSFYSGDDISPADGLSLLQGTGNNGYWLYGMTEQENWFFQATDLDEINCLRYYSGMAGLCSEARIPDCDAPVRLTDNDTDDDQMSIWGSHLVWQGFDGSDYEIYYMNLSDPTATPQPITNNSTNDFRPSIWGNCIVWEHHNGSSLEILTLSLNDLGAAPQNLSSPASGSNPKIWGNFAVWNQGDALYYHDFSKGETQLLATTGISNSRFNLWQDRIVWEGQGSSSREIFATNLADPNAVIQQLSDNAYEDSQPLIHGNFVVWVGHSTPDGQIYAFELGVSTAPELISTTSSNNNAPAVNGHLAAWVGTDGADSEIYLYDLAQLGTAVPVVMTDNSVGDFSPAIWDNYLVWNSEGKTWYLPADQPGACRKTSAATLRLMQSRRKFMDIWCSGAASTGTPSCTCTT
jgi:hypothetical protein